MVSAMVNDGKLTGILTLLLNAQLAMCKVGLDVIHTAENLNMRKITRDNSDNNQHQLTRSSALVTVTVVYIGNLLLGSHKGLHS